MNETDRELLELAAKAAGIRIEKPSPFFLYTDERGFERLNMDGSSVEWRWNPRHDDGEALRLAVKLRLAIRFDPPSHRAEWAAVARSPADHFATEFSSADLYAATRRAIVRAAAEIGRGMP